MQNIKINNIDYQIPVSWDEVTYLQGCQIIKHVNDKAMQLSCLSGIPIDTINAMSHLDVEVLFSLISFTEIMEVYDNDSVLEQYQYFDFGSIPYGQAERVKQFMQSQELNGYEACIPIIKELTGYDIENEPFLKVIGTANFFLSRSLHSIMLMPSLEKVNTAMKKAKQDLNVYKTLGALQRMLNSQEAKLSAIQ